MLYVPIRSIYVPYTFSTHNNKISLKVIRSYTFRATLPRFLENGIRSSTFCIRSLYVHHTKRTIFANSYTFPYVLCNPSQICRLASSPQSCLLAYFAHTCPHKAISFTFLYVPLYVPIRSARSHGDMRGPTRKFLPGWLLGWQPWHPWNVTISYTFLYVPLYVPIRSGRPVAQNCVAVVLWPLVMIFSAGSVLQGFLDGV